MALILMLLGVCAPEAQAPPPESTSKVKRVLLYNYNGGFECAQCREKTQEIFFHMAQAKGFSVDTTSSIADLTLENLKRFQVIVWNNNHGLSVPDSLARKAVSEFVRQGGGWMLVNIANEHTRHWAFLDSLIGPGTSGWRGQSVSAVLVPDSSAEKHPELRYFVMALPDSIPLRTNWLRVIPWEDGFEHVKTIYRIKNASWITTAPASSTDRYVWVATQGRGKALSLPLGWQGGFGSSDIMTQADSAVPRLYWQGLRWLAGDYQGGCTNPAMPNFDPEARVDNGSCPSLGMRSDRSQTLIKVKFSGGRALFSSPVSVGSRLRLVDLRGNTVWNSTAKEPVSAFDLPEGLLAGLYVLESNGADRSFHARLLVP